MLDYEHMTVTNETMTFMNKMLSFHTLCNACEIRLRISKLQYKLTNLHCPSF